MENMPAAQLLLGSRRKQVWNLILVSGRVSKEELKREHAFLQVKVKHGISRSLGKSKQQNPVKSLERGLLVILGRPTLTIEIILC